MFHGSMVALVTPMTKTGEIDYFALNRLVDWHLNSQTDAIVVLGTTGEAPTLEDKEREAIIKSVVERVKGKIPVIVGTGTNCTWKTVQLTEKAMRLGADACLIVTPYYNKPTQLGLYEHYRLIASEVPIPQILYNIPGRTGCDLLPETVGRLAEISNIVGIKEGNPERTKIIIENWGHQLDVYSADDATALEIIRQGGKGVISVTANVTPKQMHDFCKFGLQGEYNKAAILDEKLQIFHKNLFVESNPIPVKWAMSALGMIDEGIRLPLTSLNERFHDTIRNALQIAEKISV